MTAQRTLNQCRICDRSGVYVVRLSTYEYYSMACGLHLTNVVDTMLAYRLSGDMVIEHPGETGRTVEKDSVSLHLDLSGIYTRYGDHHMADMHRQVARMLKNHKAEASA